MLASSLVELDTTSYVGMLRMQHRPRATAEQAKVFCHFPSVHLSLFCPTAQIVDLRKIKTTDFTDITDYR
jgi:hypothetical protein